MDSEKDIFGFIATEEEELWVELKQIMWNDTSVTEEMKRRTGRRITNAIGRSISEIVYAEEFEPDMLRRINATLKKQREKGFIKDYSIEYVTGIQPTMNITLKENINLEKINMSVRLSV